MDGQLNIATGLSAKTRVWKNKTLLWSELVEKLSEENRTNETYKEFLAAAKEDQLKIKDVGGYVGGYLRNGRRKPENVMNRQLLTLDIDFGHLDLWDDICLQFGNAAVLHATHKHCEDSPRYRLVMPLSREASPDEYVAVARQVAGLIGIELFDNTTFGTNRLMFWPSNPKDVEYYCVSQEGDFLDVDASLATYVDWKDSSQWPTTEKAFDATKAASKKQEDPETKKGIIGAFCRTYTITEVIETFLSADYAPAKDGRYTYLKGTTAAGMITYDDKFAYSHHGTDPSGGKLCNAFDLVRIHKFGHLDISPQEGNQSSKSFKAMEEFCINDAEVKGTIASESVANAKYDFTQDQDEEEQGEPDLEWMKELDVDGKGKYLSSANNINTIFENDIKFDGLFKQNDFDGKRYVCKNVPWRKVGKPEPVKNVDYSGVRNYIESIYGITGNLKIDDSLALEFEKNAFHPVKEYLQSLVWDKEPRINRLLVDYFGAEDTLYVHEAMRKTLTGAVARIFRPGVKFDLVLTLVGAQGTGKSTFVNKLGRQWFSDTFMTVQGKEALEQIQGAWIIEMAELAGLRKAEVEAVKHFISKQEDSFRPAYARTSETYARQCIFVGTTNSKDFLRDPSGNRRFIPVDIEPLNASKDIWTDLDDEIDQIWAEAVVLFKAGETLHMSKEAEGVARIEQAKHSETDERGGLIEDYLNRLLPEDWDDKDIFERRTFINDKLSAEGTIEREFTCIAEIWCECLGKEKHDMDRYKTREINDAMRSLDGWEQSRSTKNFKLYGKQKYYFKTEKI
jgi:hypothetical protein